MTLPEESPVNVVFRRWLEENKAYIHSGIYFATGQYGSSVYTSVPLESNTTLVACPVSLIITPKLARTVLESLSSTACPLDDRESVCTYIVLHSIVGLHR